MLREDESKWLAEAEAATPGPWKMDRNWHVTGPGHDWDKCWLAPNVTLGDKDQRVCHVHGPKNHAPEDQRFIASARTAVPTLCHRLEEERRENTNLVSKLKIERAYISELAEALRERMERCSGRTYLDGVGWSCHCNLCRKAAKLLEGRGT